MTKPRHLPYYEKEDNRNHTPPTDVIIYDKATKDTEIVKWDETIEEYMAREVLPHVLDAQ